MLILMTNIIGVKICGLIPKWKIALSNCIGIICTQKYKPDSKNEHSKLMEVFERKSFPRICKSCSWKRHDVPSLCQCWAVLQRSTPSALLWAVQGWLKWPQCSVRAQSKHSWCLYQQVNSTRVGGSDSTVWSLASGINVTISFLSLCCLWADPAYGASLHSLMKSSLTTEGGGVWVTHCYFYLDWRAAIFTPAVYQSSRRLLISFWKSSHGFSHFSLLHSVKVFWEGHPQHRPQKYRKERSSETRWGF